MYHTGDRSCGGAWVLYTEGMLKDSVYEAHYASDAFPCVNVKSFSVELPFLDTSKASCMIPLKISHLLRCFDFLVTATYAKYASFHGNLAPCIWSILSGIIFKSNRIIVKYL